ncbi:zinc finger, CCHC-type containing protein, partial [Tanacetum coccineum]
MAVAAMSVVYVLTNPIPEDGENATVDQIRRRNKWDNDDYVCRGLILKGMRDPLFNIYQNVESRKELWDSLEAKYMAEDASKLLGILGRFTQHKINMDEAIQVSCIIDKLPPSWKDFKHTLKHLKEELTLVELGSHMRIEESLRTTDRGGEYIDTLYFQSIGIIHETTAPYTPQQNSIPERKNRVLKEMVNSMLSYSGLNQGFWGEATLTACYLLINRVPNKRNMITTYELWTKKKPNMNYLRVWGCRAVVRLPDPKLKTLGERGIECIFIRYAEHSKAFRFYVIEPNESVSVNLITESRDAIFDENRLFSIPRPSLRILNRTEDIGGSVIHEEVIEEVVQQPRTQKDFGPEFHLYLIEGIKDEVSYQHSYCFNVEDDPKTFDEAMKSQDVSFWKEAINDEMDSVMGNNTWVLADLPLSCKPLGCKWIFKRKPKVNGTIEKFKARVVIQGFRQKSEINYFDTYALVARISTIRLLIAMTSIQNLIIYQMDVKTAFLNGE